MNRTLVVYQSKYGSTKAAAQKLALILGPAVVITPSEFCDGYKDFDQVVIGSPVYGEQVLCEITKFIESNLKWLKSKKVALFAVSLSPSGGKAFSDLVDLLGDSVVWQATFGGVYDPASVDEKDSLAMQRFAKMTGFKNAYKDCTNEALFVKKALELKHLLKNTLSMPQEKLESYFEEFLLSHNTCTLCTGHDHEVRATPIEYMYLDKALYFFSEGGEKFAHILVNPQVSVAVYDSYAGFQKLGGLQITGTAEIIRRESEEYAKAAAKKGINPEKLKALPAALNMFKVCPESCEFLSSKLGRDGYEVRQTLMFDSICKGYSVAERSQKVD
ncbi:MAG: flavodoxin domain-containing protein [Clostridiaceae bacterium]|nr:flavodoxin domain-containing protein [Clostridiaceae bacterium]